MKPTMTASSSQKGVRSFGTGSGLYWGCAVGMGDGETAVLSSSSITIFLIFN
jgi:hypothetical protein